MADIALTHPDILQAEYDGGQRPETPLYRCDECGEGIYDGDSYFGILGYMFCEFCVDRHTHVA